MFKFLKLHVFADYSSKIKASKNTLFLSRAKNVIEVGKIRPKNERF